MPHTVQPKGLQPFASTSLVADEPGTFHLAEFMASYRLPDDPDVLFV